MAVSAQALIPLTTLGPWTDCKKCLMKDPCATCFGRTQTIGEVGGSLPEVQATHLARTSLRLSTIQMASHSSPGPTSWWWRGTTGRMTGMWWPFSLLQTTATAAATRLPSWSSMTPSSIPSFSLTQPQGVGNLMWLGKHQTTSCKGNPTENPFDNLRTFPYSSCHPSNNCGISCSWNCQAKDIQVPVWYHFVVCGERCLFFLDLFLETSIILCQYLLILNEGITGSQYKIMNDLGDIQNILAQLLLEQMKIFWWWTTLTGFNRRKPNLFTLNMSRFCCPTNELNHFVSDIWSLAILTLPT